MTRRRVTHLNHYLIPSIAACKHWDTNGLGIGISIDHTFHLVYLFHLCEVTKVKWPSGLHEAANFHLMHFEVNCIVHTRNWCL